MQIEKLPHIVQDTKITSSLKEEETLCDATDILDSLAQSLAEGFDDGLPKLAFKDPKESVITQFNSLTFDQIQEAITVIDTVITMLQASNGLEIVLE